MSRFEGKNNATAEREQIIKRMIGALTTSAKIREEAIEETKAFEASAERPQHTYNHPNDDEGRERGQAPTDQDERTPEGGEAEKEIGAEEGSPKSGDSYTRQAHNAGNNRPQPQYRHHNNGWPVLPYHTVGGTPPPPSGPGKYPAFPPTSTYVNAGGPRAEMSSIMSTTGAPGARPHVRTPYGYRTKDTSLEARHAPTSPASPSPTEAPAGWGYVIPFGTVLVRTPGPSAPLPTPRRAKEALGAQPCQLHT